jgi:hypothetical protein
VHLTFLPLSPVRPASALFRVEMLAAKTLAKQFGVRAISKTKHDVICVSPPHNAATRGEREDATEFVLDTVVLTRDLIGRHSDLMRPVAIDFAARQFAFTPSHRKSASHVPESVPRVAGLGRGDCLAALALVAQRDIVFGFRCGRTCLLAMSRLSCVRRNCRTKQEQKSSDVLPTRAVSKRESLSDVSAEGAQCRFNCRRLNSSSNARN